MRNKNPMHMTDKQKAMANKFFEQMSGENTPLPEEIKKNEIADLSHRNNELVTERNSLKEKLEAAQNRISQLEGFIYLGEEHYNEQTNGSDDGG